MELDKYPREVRIITHRGTNGHNFKVGATVVLESKCEAIGRGFLASGFCEDRQHVDEQIISARDFEEIETPTKVSISKDKLKYKRYTDGSGDSFKVDCQYSTQHVSFEPQDDKEDVILDAKQVIALRKQLKHWLVAHGHNEKGE